MKYNACQCLEMREMCVRFRRVHQWEKKMQMLRVTNDILMKTKVFLSLFVIVNLDFLPKTNKKCSLLLNLHTFSLYIV